MAKWRIVLLATVLAILAMVAGLGMLMHRQPAPKTKTIASAVASTPPMAIASVVSEPIASSDVKPTEGIGRDYSKLPDGRPVPPLPETAPRQVTFGAILFTFEGAQVAPRRARSKAEALSLAKQTVELASKDFFEAAKKGDPGSTADAGSIGRGVLEPSTEYLLFTLDKGAVYPEPLETPRGYWLMRRVR